MSVLVSNYNRREFIAEALQSVLDQTYPYFELIVCDDGSTDGSADTVREFVALDRRMRLIEKANGGQPSGFNAAYESSHGQIICFLDSDDVFLLTKLERVVKTFQAHRDAGFIAHRVYRVDRRRERQGILPLFSRIPTGWLGDRVLREGGILDNLPPCAGLAIRREVAQRIFPLRENGPLRNYGDSPIMRLAPMISVTVGLNEPLAEWRHHGANHGSTLHLTAAYIARELRSYGALWELQRDYLAAWHPEILEDLAPPESNPHVAEMLYAHERLRGGGSAWCLYRNLIRKLKSSPDPAVKKLFWLCSYFLPRAVFSRTFDLLSTQGPLKQWLSRFHVQKKELTPSV